jgi:hypothetical protein
MFPCDFDFALKVSWRPLLLQHLRVEKNISHLTIISFDIWSTAVRLLTVIQWSQWTKSSLLTASNMIQEITRLDYNQLTTWNSIILCKLVVVQLVKKLAAFHGMEVSSPWSQQPGTGPCPELVESIQTFATHSWSSSVLSSHTSDGIPSCLFHFRFAY